MSPLGNIANSLTPPPQAEGIRRLKWRLREHAGALLPRKSLPDASGALRDVAHRVGRCGRMLVGGTATVLVGEAMGKTSARFVGLETCGSVWLCPVCSAKIAEHKRADIEAIVTAHVEGRRLMVPEGPLPGAGYGAFTATRVLQTVKGGGVYMATLTVPHARWDGLRGLREGVAVAWGRLINGAPWKRTMARYGIVGLIRSMEVTHGDRNGWHPHLHVLLLADVLTEEAETRLRDWIAERWSRIALRMGLADEDRAWDVYEHGVEMHRAERVQAAGEYVAKWGCDAELTKWHTKAARGKNRSPWQLLAAAADGDVEARMRWREFAAVFAGTRHLTMSHGLRDLYLGEPELSDEEIAAQEHGIDPAEIIKNTGETIAGRLRRGLWVRVVTAGLAVPMLEAIEAGGWDAALDLLADKGLALRRYVIVT